MTRLKRAGAAVAAALAVGALALPFIVEEPERVCQDIKGARYCDISKNGHARDVFGKPTCVPDSLCAEQEGYLPRCDGYEACLPTIMPPGATPRIESR